MQRTAMTIKNDRCFFICELRENHLRAISSHTKLKFVLFMNSVEWIQLTETFIDDFLFELCTLALRLWSTHFSLSSWSNMERKKTHCVLVFHWSDTHSLSVDNHWTIIIMTTMICNIHTITHEHTPALSTHPNKTIHWEFDKYLNK